MATSLAPAILAVALGAQPAGPALPTGQLVEGVACQADPSQTYTLYLPSGYTTEKRWPLLLILDPRGRSRLAAELFREAAEARGYVLISSNDTRSDGPMERNARAVQALWPEAHLRYASDPRRIYAAGFSGGGIVAYQLARRSEGRLAGVVASGARWEDFHFKERFEVPCFGAAGDTDFNYARMLGIHARLREWGTPERLEIFAGPHQWLPAPLAAQAIAWLDLQAMKSARLPRDAAFVAAQLQAELERARALEADGRFGEARQRLDNAVATFDGLTDTSEARREGARVAALNATRAEQKEHQKWDRYEERTWRRLDMAYSNLLSSDPPPTLPSVRGEIGVEELTRRARAPGYEGTVARRLLETLATQTGFYMSRDLLAKEDYPRARTALAIAAEAAPGRPYVWYKLACAEARLGAKREALDALERAVAAGFSDRARIADDEDLASLRGEPRFRALVAAAPQQ